MKMQFSIKFSLHLVLAEAILCLPTGSGTTAHQPCPLGTFACNGSDVKCVEQRLICDGNKDCPSGSDEQKCDNTHHYQQWNNRYRKRPDADSEKTSGNCSLAKRPEVCVCSAHKLICNNMGLTEAPQSLPSATRQLDLSSNEIESLSSKSFVGLNELEVLLLTNCLIKEIGNDTFDIPNLKKLYLTGNQLTSITTATFATNMKLEILDLRYNQISQIDIGSFKKLSSLIKLDICCNRLTSVPQGAFTGLSQLQLLYLSENQLTILFPKMFSSLTRLQFMYLTKNRILRIEDNAFANMESMHGLDLSANHLEVLQNGALGNLTSLLSLDLSQNRLRNIEAGVFDSLISLQSLDFRKNSFRHLPEETLRPLINLTHIYFDEFFMCAFALHVRVCEPKGDGISSLKDLLDSRVLRFTVWLVAISACLGNALQLVGRLVIKEPNEVHSLYIKNLSVADFLMGVYLMIIAAYDVHFRGAYIRHDEQWRHSWQCNFCGFLSTLSSESSVFTLTVITFDRYASISRPLSVKRRTKRFAYACVALLWLFALILSALPVLPIPYYGKEFYGGNGVCLPLHIHDPYARAWEYSAAMFVALNFVAFSFILYAYVRMFFIIKDSTLALRSTQEKQDRVIAKRFAFIVGTDFMCWMPIIIIKILALFGTAIHENLYAWLAVFVLPVNSALNPILYTLTTKLFRQQICFWVYKNKQKAANSGGQQQNASGLSLSYVFFHRRSWSKRNIQSRSVSTGRSSVKSCSSRESSKRCRINNNSAMNGAEVQRCTQV